METVYMVCAVAGGSVLVIQTILLVVGGATDSTDADADVGAGDVHLDHVDVHTGDVQHEVHHDVQHEDAQGTAQQVAFLKMLTLKTIVAFITFFGLVGMACQRASFKPLPTLLIAIGAGVVALYIVGYIMSGLTRLQSRGNINLANAVGETGKVYLRIPGERSGTGKVNVVVQGRMVECKALTAGPEIPTGAEIQIVGTAGPNMLEVTPVAKR